MRWKSTVEFCPREQMNETAGAWRTAVDHCECLVALNEHKRTIQTNWWDSIHCTSLVDSEWEGSIFIFNIYLIPLYFETFQGETKSSGSVNGFSKRCVTHVKDHSIFANASTYVNGYRNMAYVVSPRKSFPGLVLPLVEVAGGWATWRHKTSGIGGIKPFLLYITRMVYARYKCATDSGKKDMTQETCETPVITTGKLAGLSGSSVARNILCKTSKNFCCQCRSFMQRAIQLREIINTSIGLPFWLINQQNHFMQYFCV